MTIISKLMSKALVMGLTIGSVLVMGWEPAATQTQSAKGKQLLDSLIARARQEGALDATITSSGAKVAPDVVRAFKGRFGLDIKIHLDVVGGESRKFKKLQATLKAGARPPFDTLQGGGDNNTELIEQGLAIPVDNWKLLLAAINPLVSSGQVKPEQISPPPFTGYSLLWANRTKSLLYNTKLISKNDIPKRRADLADPKFKGKFPVPPWTSAVQLGVLVYDKNEWLKIVDGMGKNAAAVLRFSASLERMLLGEFEFAPQNTYYIWQTKAKDANAPLGQHWFEDYTAMTSLFYIVPVKARHPAAGTLFALWMTTPEAQGIVQSAAFHPNVRYGQSDLDRAVRKSLKDSGSKLVTWYDSPKTIKVLKWFGTKEGRKYRSLLTKAQTQRK